MAYTIPAIHTYPCYTHRHRERYVTYMHTWHAYNTSYTHIHTDYMLLAIHTWHTYNTCHTYISMLHTHTHKDIYVSCYTHIHK
jgi:hypothetical protein